MTISIKQLRPTEWLMALLLVGLLAFCISGCATTPRGQYAQVQDTYIAAVEVLVTAHAQGVFEPDEWEEDIVPLIELGNALLDDYDAVTEAGGSGIDLLNAVKRVLKTLEPYIAKALDE